LGGGNVEGILRKVVRKDVNLKTGIEEWRKLCNWVVPSLMFG